MSSTELTELRNLKAFEVPHEHTVGQLFYSYVASKYSQHCQEIKSIRSTVMSIDHSFKVALRIVTNSNSVIRKQFGSILIVINEEGAVIWWAFLKNASLKDAKKSFKELASRNAITICYTDKCCEDRGIIQVHTYCF